MHTACNSHELHELGTERDGLGYCFSLILGKWAHAAHAICSCSASCYYLAQWKQLGKTHTTCIEDYNCVPNQVSEYRASNQKLEEGVAEGALRPVTIINCKSITTITIITIEQQGSPHRTEVGGNISQSRRTDIIYCASC